MAIRVTTGERVFRAVNSVILVILAALCLYPLLYVLSMSISDPMAVASGKVVLFPVGDLSFESYRFVISNRTTWRSYANTIYYVCLCTLFSLLMTVLYAYPLSCREFTGRKFFTIVMAITMFLSSGQIPMFILIRQLGLYNTRAVIIITGAMSTYNIIMMRTYIQSNIPDSLAESARIDGASEFYTMVRIVLPLSTPILATLGLFKAVGQWNSFFSHVLYQPDSSLHPLQVHLRNVLILGSNLVDDPSAAAQDVSLVAIQIKYAYIIFSLIPILCVYPFVQKYFTKGVMIGSIKG